MAVVAKITSIHQSLFRVGTFCAVLGGCAGLWDSIKYARTDEPHSKMHLFENFVISTGGGIIMGFTIGYGSPVILPVAIFEGVKNSY